MRILLVTALTLVFFSFDAAYVQAQEQSDSLKTGWVKFSTNIDKFYVIIDNDYQNYMTVNSGDSIKLATGNRIIRMVWRNINDHVFYADIRKDTSFVKYIDFYITNSPRSSFSILEESENLLIFSDKESQIYLDGNYLGKQVADTLIAPGNYNLIIENEMYGALAMEVLVNPYVVNRIGRYNNDPTPLSGALKFLPGAGYMSTQQYGKASFTYAALIGLVTSSFIIGDQYQKNENRFNELNQLYLNAETVSETLRYRREANSVLKEMDSQNDQLTITSIAAVLVYAFTTWDGLRKPRTGYSGPSSIEPSFSVNQITLGQSYYPEVTIRANFK